MTGFALAHPSDKICHYVGTASAGERHQFEYTAKFRGGRNVALSQSGANSVEFGGVLDGEIGRPTCVILDQLDRDFCSVPALMDQLDGPAGHLVFHRLRTATTITASLSSTRSAKDGPCALIYDSINVAAVLRHAGICELPGSDRLPAGHG